VKNWAFCCTIGFSRRRNGSVRRWAALHRELVELRPAGQLMSGSGSTVFALCRRPGEAIRIARALRSGREEGDGVRVLIVRSCS